MGLSCVMYLNVEILVHENVIWLDVFVYDPSVCEVHHPFQNL